MTISEGTLLPGLLTASISELSLCVIEYARIIATGYQLDAQIQQIDVRPARKDCASAISETCHEIVRGDEPPTSIDQAPAVQENQVHETPLRVRIPYS